MAVFRQLFDPESSTYTYLLGEAGEAVLIDPVREQAGRDLALLARLGLRLVWSLDTHVHADHVTAAALLQARTGCATAVGQRAGVACADRLLAEGDEIRFGGEVIRVLETPGHTAGCVSYLWRDRLFTGDALLIGGCGRTDFQDGDPGTLYDSIVGKLFTLPDETLVYPAHDYEGRRVSCIGQEKAINPRLAGRSREAFVALMESMAFPLPRRIQVAVPANRRCGREGIGGGA
ncbi:MBL fold metallo-hydrolase [Inmirania thermothiophila]|uniref:Glyoxylase-like metal-dependent hydrolase (Beta-lactamase superfamily II) n=1 Tax=Inmirania thermothiophila TaxID=1750597 RepID=A0A3N1Y6C0_9GAMM|nr:MBL fold metallo-hydrolase [Inmirania thermothiophila]ROR32857.1 glyoxylase-like metal-dependent hydrolase (beta-lactamase superfamily II) [Inmirania thermothiophila]